MNLRVKEDEQAKSPKAGAAKFAYPSGSRPLAGYAIKRGVGRGGFGEVYFATSDAGKEVALKLIRRNLDVELRGVKQCLNLKHPNLIGLYDIRSDEYDNEWVIMEYVSGESLDSVIDWHPDGLPVDQVLWWMRGVCAGVAHLHDHGIVHRDLKPGNIFSDQGIVKVGDYGLAKFISCSRRSGQTESVGTVHYMAPEISNGRYGKEIDTYALGIILYELLTGKVPFEGESVGEVLMKHLTAEPDLDQLEMPYRDIVRRALAKDPDVRLKSVQEMIALLPGGEPVHHEAAAQPYGNSVDGSAMPAGAQTVPAGETEDIGHLEPAEPEEPIYAAIRDGWAYCEHAWDTAQLHPIVRAILIFAGMAALISTAGFWLPVLFFGFLFYAIYYAIRGLVLQAGGENRRTGRTRTSELYNTPRPHNRKKPDMPNSIHADAHVGTAHPPRPVHPQRSRRLKHNWKTKVYEELHAKPLRAKLSELLGSMLLAALVAVIVGLIALAFSQPDDPMALHVWLTVVGTLGCWAVLIPSKFAEGRIEDQVPMRLMLMVLGTVVGVVAWGLSDSMALSLTNSLGVSPRDTIAFEWFGWERNVWLGGAVAYFAFLFAFPRWWRQAEFMRHRRLSLWAVAWCVICAYALHFVFWFPQPAGMMAAGVIAIATQLSSPWLPFSQRRLLAEETVAAAKREGDVAP